MTSHPTSHALILVMALAAAAACSNKKTAMNGTASNANGAQSDAGDSHDESASDQSDKSDKSGSQNNPPPVTTTGEDPAEGAVTCDALYAAGDALFDDLTAGASQACQTDDDCVAVIELKTTGCGDSLGTAIANAELQQDLYTEHEALRAEALGMRCGLILPQCFVAPRVITGAKCNTVTNTCETTIN